MNPDEAARAASDAIGAWCAANPVPAWQHRPVDTGLFTAPTEPVEAAYIRAADAEAFLESLTDGQRQAIYDAADRVAQSSGCSREYALGALILAVSNRGSAGATERR